MAETKTKVIDGITFKVAPLQAITALKLKMRLLRVVAPALGYALGSLGGSSLGASLSASSAPKSEGKPDLAFDGQNLASALASLMGNLDEEEFLAILRRCFETVQATFEIPGKGPTVMIFAGNNFEPAFNVIFETRLFTVYSLLAFVLEVNYPDFFIHLAAIGSRLGTLFTKKGSESAENSPSGLEGSET